MPTTIDTGRSGIATSRPVAAVPATLRVQFVGAAGPGAAIAHLPACGIEPWSPAGGGSPALLFAAVAGGRQARAARRAARRARCPLVIDLIEPWALDGQRVFATPLHLAAERRAMRAALNAATAIVVRAPAMIPALAELGIDPRRVFALPAGCAVAARLPASSDGRFRLWVASALQPAIHPTCPTSDGLLQRRPRQIEPAGATSFYLFSALAALRNKRPELFDRLAVHFAAPLDSSNRDIAEWLAVESAFATATSVPAAADAVFVCQPGELAGQRALGLPDGFFAAIATGRPLLAAVAAGDAPDLVRRHALGLALPACDAPPLCRALEAMLLGNGPPAPTVPAQFAAGAVAEGLALALRAVAAAESLPAAAHALWPGSGKN